jgi:membrane-bound lytic murein transglycosylase D
MKHLFVILGLIAGVVGYAQTGTSAIKKDTLQLQDDPIAALLDSLSHLNFFEKGVDVVKSSNYHYADDSTPWFSDAVFADRFSKLDANTPFDLEYNNVVKQYIALYARKKQMTSRILALSKLYFPLIEQILDRYKMPLELKYLAVVESALNPNACSRTGARGLWQFMYTTGKLYNLQVTSYMDERNDPVRSTIAACQYLKFLHDTFGDWQLAIAAYNCGPMEVSKAIRRSGGKVNFWQIRPYLPRETEGYVPAFIAVNYIMNYATAHNIYPSIPIATYFDVDTVTVHHELTFNQISSYLNIPVDEVSYLNPCYKLGVVPYSAEGCYTLCLPVSKVGTFVTNEQAIYNMARKDTLTSQQILAMEQNEQQVEYHRVRPGEHLSTIANRYHCTVRELKEWNGLQSANVKPGQHLMVYVSRSNHRPYADNLASSNTKKKSKSSNGLYVVQSGDTLWHISQATGVSIAELKKLNHLTESSKLAPGSKIKLAATAG